MAKFFKLKKGYQTITYAEVVGKDLKISFADKNTVTLPLKKILVSGYKNLQLDDLYMDFDGSRIMIPAKPMDFEIPWHAIRQLTDPVFSKTTEEFAKRQQIMIGERLQSLRKARNFSIEKLSKKSALPASAVRNIEKGIVRVNHSRLKKLLDSMGCSFSDLADPKNRP